MSRDAGVVRNREGLSRLLQDIADLEAANGQAASLAAARLVAAAALARTESRGAHFRSDSLAGSPAQRTFLRLADVSPNPVWMAAE